MSMNPSYDPRQQRGAGRPANISDEEYRRQLAAQPGMYAAPETTEVSRTVTNTPVQVNTMSPVIERDRVRWGPILAGLVSALATLLVLSLIGVAVGLTAAAGDPNGGAPAAATNNANNYGLGATIWAIVSALISFFLGGFVAGRTAGVRGKGNGWINGALVWAVTLPLLIWLASSGASGFLNAIGFNLNGFLNNVTGAVNNPTGAANANPATVQQATETARNGAWGAVAALLIGLIASGLGGLVGSRSHDDELTENDGVVR